MRLTETAPLPWLWLGASSCAAAAVFVPSAPLQLALAPLLMAVWRGTRPARTLAAAMFLAPPCALCAWGLAGTGLSPALAVSGAAALCAALSAAAAVTGVTAAGAMIAAVPFLPFSPAAAVAAGIPGLGLPGLVSAALALAAVEALRRPRIRGSLVLALAAAALLAEAWRPSAPDTAGWTEMREPAALTERARWIALRSLVPPGSELVLGENVFAAGDSGALAFWCAAAASRGLTVYAGVSESGSGRLRGTVRRLDASSCAGGGLTVYAARFGIPLLTGGWTRMDPPARPSSEPSGAADWLLCLEAFLPQAWAPLLAGRGGGPVLVLSNDSAFDALPLPGGRSAERAVRALRRKAADAMAGLSGRAALHAETGKTFLLRKGERQ